MKSLTKLSLVAALTAIISTGAASADSQRLENRLARQHAKIIANDKPTIAFGGTAPKVRFELLANGHGEITGAYVPVD